MIKDMNLITDEHDLNCLIDALIEDVDLRCALENEFKN